MKFHPYSEIFPLIEGAEFEALVEDIKAHGLREKIWIYEGKILDGRNRFLACQKAKVRPAFRKFTGKDAGAFVWSMNVPRRHLSASQLAMAVARRATLEKGTNQHAQNCAPSQAKAAGDANISRRIVQHARKVIDEGSKALQRAVESGELSVAKAASVVDLPKAEQLRAATQKPEPSTSDEPERPDDIDEDAALAAAEQEYMASAEKALGTDALTEIKRLTAELTVVKLARDGFMNGKAAVTKLLRAEQRKTERLEKENAKLARELENLRERIATMEAA